MATSHQGLALIQLEMIWLLGLSDKKPASINWIKGCGKSDVCEAIIKEELVTKVLNMLKNLWVLPRGFPGDSMPILATLSLNFYHGC